MGKLQSALDALATLDLDELPDGLLLEHTRELVTASHRIAAALTRVARRVDVRGAAECDGAKNATLWLRGHARVSGASASRVVAQGRVLELLPATARAFTDGVLGADQVTVIAKIATPVHLDLAATRGIDVAAVETALVQLASRGTHRDLELAVADYLAKLDPDGPEPDPTEERSVTLVQHPDGTWTIRGELDAVGGQKVATALEAIAAASRCADDQRTRAQRTGDALVQLADTALAAGKLPVLRTVRPHVIATIGVEDLVDPATGPGAATTGTGTRLSAARTRWLACDATLTRLLLDPDGLPLDVGRDQRVVPPHIRRAVEHRDQHCVFAGCEAPRWYCDKRTPAPPTARKLAAGPCTGADSSQANATTPRSTTASASTATTPPHPKPDGAPTAPTAPRSSSAPPPTPDSEDGEDGVTPGGLTLRLTDALLSCCGMCRPCGGGPVPARHRAGRP